MSVFRLLVELIQAVLRAAVAGFLAIVALGAVWALGVAALIGVVVLALIGFGGWRAARRRHDDAAGE